MDNLADALVALATDAGPEPASDPADDLRRAGERLVEVLRDQFADGQVEALYSVQKASAALKTHVQELSRAHETGASTLRSAMEEHHAALERLVAEVVERTTTQVGASLTSILTETRSSLGAQLAAEVEGSTAQLRSAATQHAHQVASQLEQTSDQLASLHDAALARSEQARLELDTATRSLIETGTANEAALVVAGEGLTEQVRAAAGELGAASETVQEALERATTEARAELTRARAELIEARTELTQAADAARHELIDAAARARSELADAAAEARELLRDGADEVLEQTRAAVDELRGQVEDARAIASADLEVLRLQVQTAERREQSAGKRLQGQVDALVARTDDTMASALAHLRAVTDVLLERDAQLEARRVDEFVRVLDVVLREGGGSSRKLRDRIFRGVEAVKDQPLSAATTRLEAVDETGEQAVPDAIAGSAPAGRAPAKRGATARAAAPKRAAAATQRAMEDPPPAADAPHSAKTEAAPPAGRPLAVKRTRRAAPTRPVKRAPDPAPDASTTPAPEELP